MALRLSGLNSGLDTESIISALVSAKSLKVTSVKGSQTKLSWKQAAWSSLNSKVTALYNNTLSKLRFTSSYIKKSTNVTNDSAVSVVTGSNAVNSVQSLSVDKLAKTAYLTGGAVATAGGSALSNSTKISDLKGFNGAGNLSLKVGDNTTNIEINENTTVQDVVSKLQSAGLNASFDAKNARFFVSAKESGAKNDFTITAADGAGASALNALGLGVSLANDPATLSQYRSLASKYVAPSDGVSADEARTQTLANLTDEIDTEISKRVASYVSSYDNAKKAIETANTTISDLEEKYADKGGTSYLQSVDAYTEQITDLNKNISDLETKISSLERSMSMTANGELLARYNQEKAEAEAELNASKEQVETLTAEKNDATALAGAQKTIADSEAAIAEAENMVDLTTDESGNTVGTAKEALNTAVEDYYYNQAKNAADTVAAYDAGKLTGNYATKINGTDAEITLNDAKFTGSSNTFDINGLTITAKQVTSEDVTLTTQDDTEGIYDTIKGFLKEYNSLINEMAKLYNAEDASSYKMLTSEEKDAMSETEAKDWEDKIKSALLRKDNNLNTIMMSMRNAMSGVIDVNGSKMSLATFGINTLGYFNAEANERYAYHIDGDEDDSSTSTNADKLKTMIANNPSDVIDFFTQLSRNLYSAFSDNMKSNSNRSAFSIYDDKKMKADYTDYTSKISKMEAMLTDYEDRYYKQFSAMETALAKLSSKQTAVAGLLGSGGR